MSRVHGDLRWSQVDRVRTRFERFDDRFRGCDGDEWIERLYGNGRWLEGPAYFPAGRYLVFSDIPNDRLLRWDETTGAVGVFREPANFANGNLRDRLGRLVTCEQGTRRLTRTEPDGTVTVLADQWRGRRFNSPDVVVEHSDGGLWFSDPTYGIASDYEGVRGTPELEQRAVFRLDPDELQVEPVIEDLSMPNGLAFSPDESRLYVVDCAENCIHQYDVLDGRRLAEPAVLAHGDTGPLDSLTVDSGGRVWAAAGHGVDCYGPDGTRLGRLRLPETVANLTFGGPRRNDLFIAATSSLYRLRLKVTGCR
ncbi:MAG TPA: SMP-30/gluconolactonase/LRE family protein [Marmoricola sp.]|nr:SMP-30/gluconolactonase/LRE family protein [Marmoricola sp.]